MATETLRPTGAGGYTECSPSSGANWECVDDTSSDSDTTYVYTMYGTDTYALGDSAVGAGTINSVTVYAVARYVYAKLAIGGIRLCVEVSGSLFNPNYSLMTTSYTTYSDTWATNPATSAAWSWSDVNALRAGITIDGGEITTARCTQVYVVVDYTAAAAGIAVPVIAAQYRMRVGS